MYESDRRKITDWMMYIYAEDCRKNLTRLKEMKGGGALIRGIELVLKLKEFDEKTGEPKGKWHRTKNNWPQWKYLGAYGLEGSEKDLLKDRERARVGYYRIYGRANQEELDREVYLLLWPYVRDFLRSNGLKYLF